MEKPEPVKVNSNVIEIMGLNRHERRRIGKQFGVKTIPSIKNVEITKVEPEQKDDTTTLQSDRQS